MQCKIKQLIDVKKEVWNSFVYANSMGWAYFLYDVISMDRHVNKEDMSFCVVDIDNNDEILMLVQLHKVKSFPLLSKFNLGNKLESLWGYVVKDNLTKKQAKQVKKTFEDYIDDYIRKNNIRKFNISLPPLTEKFLTNKSFINPLIYFNFSPKISYTCVVDLSKPQERMLADCEETTRQAIRKIKASEQYEIIESSGTKEELEEYINLHKETYTRTGAEGHIIHDSYHEQMFNKLIPEKICRVYFLRDKSTNTNIASVAILVYKNTAYYWWGCSKNEKGVGINKYLLFNVILKLKEEFKNTGYFETGGAYPHKRSGKYKGLYDFKKSFGTTLFPIYSGTYEMIKRKKHA